MKNSYIKYISLFIISLVFFICFFAGNAYSAEIKWVNPSGGNWSNPANWSTGSVPGTNDDAVIDLPGFYTVTADINIR